MKFQEYYQKKDVVNSYDHLRLSGIKAKVIRKLELKFIDFLVEKNKNKKILEIGVGTGFISKLLIKKGDFSGMDISKEMLKKASKNLGKVNLIPGDILNLKLKNKYDTIVTIRVLGHFNKKDAIIALRNASSYLKPGGKVIFNLENKSFLKRFVRKIRNWGSTHTYQYSEKDVFGMVKKSNLEVKKIIYLDHLFILPLHLLNKILFNKLENIICRIEFKLKDSPFMHNNFFIKCQK